MREKKSLFIVIGIIVDLYLGLALDVKGMVILGALCLVGIFATESLTAIFKH